MNSQERVGLMMVFAASFFSLAAILVSSGYSADYDIVENLILRLRISFFCTNDNLLGSCSQSEVLVNIETKYVVLIFAALGTYGVLIFLGVLKAPEKLTKRFQ